MGSPVFTIVTVFVLELIAFGLGLGAERRRATGTLETDSTGTYQWCSYTSDVATGLGLGALLFLLAGHLVITASTRCLCCGNVLKPGAARAFSIILFLLIWIFFIIAGTCYLAGSIQNAKHTRYFSYLSTGTLTCEAIRKDTFAAGVAFTFFTFVLSISYYLCYAKAMEGGWRDTNRKDTSIGMTSYT